MLAHVDRFRRADQQTGRMRLWIDMENADLGRICTEIRQNLVPFKVRQILELWRIRRSDSAVRLLGISTQRKTYQGRHHKREMQFLFHRLRTEHRIHKDSEIKFKFY